MTQTRLVFHVQHRKFSYRNFGEIFMNILYIFFFDWVKRKRQNEYETHSSITIQRLRWTYIPKTWTRTSSIFHHLFNIKKHLCFYVGRLYLVAIHRYFPIRKRLNILNRSWRFVLRNSMKYVQDSSTIKNTVHNKKYKINVRYIYKLLK